MNSILKYLEKNTYDLKTTGITTEILNSVRDGGLTLIFHRFRRCSTPLRYRTSKPVRPTAGLAFPVSIGPTASIATISGGQEIREKTL